MLNESCRNILFRCILFQCSTAISRRVWTWALAKFITISNQCNKHHVIFLHNMKRISSNILVYIGIWNTYIWWKVNDTYLVTERSGLKFETFAWFISSLKLTVQICAYRGLKLDHQYPADAISRQWRLQIEWHFCKVCSRYFYVK